MECILKINDLEVGLGSEAQREIARVLPDYPHYSELFRQFASSTDSEVRESVAKMDSITSDTAEILLKDNDPFVLKAILFNKVAARLITTAEVLNIIDNCPHFVVEVVAAQYEEYEKVNTDQVLKKLIDLNSAVVNRQMADGWSTTAKIARALSESSDPDVRCAALKRLT